MTTTIAILLIVGCGVAFIVGFHFGVQAGVRHGMEKAEEIMKEMGLPK